MYELNLQAKTGNWRIFAGRKDDEAFRPLEKRVFERDNHTCQFCGFQAHEYQDVVNLDGNYRNNKLENLATACCFCSQCLFLEAVGLDEMGGGQLIYLPEISQADLNSFCHVLFCALGNGTAYEDTAQSLYRTFKFRSQIIEEKFGEGSSNPAMLGQMLIEHSADNADANYDFLKDVRLLPSHTKFKVQLDAWAAAAMAELAAEDKK